MAGFGGVGTAALGLPDSTFFIHKKTSKKNIHTIIAGYVEKTSVNLVNFLFPERCFLVQPAQRGRKNALFFKKAEKQ